MELCQFIPAEYMWLPKTKTEITEEHQIRHSFLKDVPIATGEARISQTHHLLVNLGSFLNYYHADDSLWCKEQSLSAQQTLHASIFKKDESIHFSRLYICLSNSHLPRKYKLPSMTYLWVSSEKLNKKYQLRC